LSSVTGPAPNLLEAARLALRVGGLTDSLAYPVVSGTGIKGGKPAKLPTQRRHHVLGGTVALKAGENDRILPRDSGRARPDVMQVIVQHPITGLKAGSYRSRHPLVARGRLRQSRSARDSNPAVPTRGIA
jgi:hypothetical protein